MSRPDDASPRMLIIRPSALGDVCRSVPALVTLRRAQPQAKIDWLVSEALADAVRHHPALDEVVTFPRHRFGSALLNPAVAAESIAWARQLRRRRYDVVFDLQGLFRSGLFTLLTGAGRRVGDANARELAWLGYNQKHPIDPRLHTVDRTLQLMAAAGYQPTPDMRLYVGDADRAWADDLLAEHQWSDKPYACIAPTARWRCKCWPIESFTAIARRLIDAGAAGGRIVLIASPDETRQVQPLLEALEATGRVLFPRTTVGQMMALISRCTLMICNDSAPLHVAVGFDRPIVTIFGPTDPALVGPYGKPEAVVQPPDVRPEEITRYRRLRDDQSLIARVPVEAVWQRVEAVAAR